MSNQIIVPSLGESVTEATVSKWLKQVGDKVDSDEPLVELETDKVNVEVPSPLSGVLSSINVEEGSTVAVGALLGLVAEGKADKVKSSKTKLNVQDEKTYTPPKKVNRKKDAKGILKSEKILKLSQENQEEISKEIGRASCRERG